MHSTDHSPKPSAPFAISGAEVTPPPYAFISCTASDAVLEVVLFIQNKGEMKVAKEKEYENWENTEEEDEKKKG
jgi:hypothetical protein